MPDGSRKRRFSQNFARRQWYAHHRSRRFSRRFGWLAPGCSASRPLLHRTSVAIA
jgi:hypothetical protein